uniref:DUF4283 domain-containing protein n=1 Tax=Cannabis sativa TaxID=3483 RepID=A0A803P6D8_CANSA
MARTRSRAQGKMKSRPSNKGKRKGVQLETEDTCAGTGLEKGEVNELVLSEEEMIDTDTPLIDGVQEPLSPGASLKIIQRPSIVCYVLGVNPPLQIMEGFAKRMWGDKLDRVKLLSYGIYIIRFNNEEFRDQVLNGGFIFFNRRSVIMKPWNPNDTFSKEDVTRVPIWIQLEGLELKYWGEKSLFKIVGQMGKPIMVDAITKERERLSYPRILIEVSMDKKLPEMLEFEDEQGWNSSIGVKYEWKPSICTHCSGLGHIADDCRKGKVGKA